jgi:GAF domain-containing protein
MPRRSPSAASQETKVARLTRELSEALKQQTATTEVLKVISRSAFDLQTVLNTLVESVGRLCDAERTIIFRPHDDAYRLVASYDYSEEFRELLAAESFKPGRDSVSGRIAAEKTIVHILDYQADPELRFQGPFEVPTRTILGVPLLREGALVGIMTLARSVVRPFNAKQIELATIFADQAVIAIENTRLLSELRQRTTDLTERTAELTETLEQQTATSEVLKVVNSSPGDLAPVFDAMLEKALNLCEAAFGGLWIYDGERLHATAMRGVPALFAEFHNKPLEPVPGTGSYALVHGEDFVHVADVTDDEGYRSGNPAKRALGELGGARTALWLPLRKDHALLGTFMVYRQEVRPFTNKQIALLQNFAAQAVIAMENARLLNELRQRTTDLTESLEQQTATAEVLRVISSSPSELRPVFQTMLANATRLCEAKFGILDIYENGAFRTVAMHNVPQEFAELRRRAGPPSNAVRSISPTA